MNCMPVVMLLTFFAALASAEDHDDPAMLQTGAQERAKENLKGGGISVPMSLDIEKAFSKDCPLSPKQESQEEKCGDSSCCFYAT